MADPKLGNFELILSDGQTDRQDRRTNRKIRGTCTIAPFGGKNHVHTLSEISFPAFGGQNAALKDYSVSDDAAKYSKNTASAVAVP